MERSYGFLSNFASKLHTALWGYVIAGPSQRGTLAEQLTLSQPGGQIMPTTVIQAPPNFRTLRRPCLLFHFEGGRHASFPQKPVVKWKLDKIIIARFTCVGWCRGRSPFFPAHPWTWYCQASCAWPCIWRPPPNRLHTSHTVERRKKSFHFTMENRLWDLFSALVWKIISFPI